jgi:hypothetical protein
MGVAECCCTSELLRPAAAHEERPHEDCSSGRVYDQMTQPRGCPIQGFSHTF